MDHVDPKLSAAENFIILNRITGSRRCLVPMSSFEDKFITLSELDLTKVFWHQRPLREQLQLYAHPDFPSISSPDKVTQADVGLWVGRIEPGSLINKLISDIGSYPEEERRKMRSYSRTAIRMTLDEMKDHLRVLRQETFDPALYTAKGYLLRGSIKTDGFRLQLLAFKIHELHCVKFRRLPAERLPERLTSTLGGNDYFLKEIRNVVSSKEDVAALWDCDASQIKIVGVDLGQAFVVGASAILPSSKGPVRAHGQEAGGEETEEVQLNRPRTFHNLSVKQKAVYQPTLKHRRWLELRKRRAIDGAESVNSIETGLPPRHGPNARFVDHVRRVQEVESNLESFYASIVLRKHGWNARKARDKEYRLIADHLLGLVGGSTGAKRDEGNKVVIGIGLGQFSSRMRLSSLHGTFMSFFVQKVSMPRVPSLCVSFLDCFLCRCQQRTWTNVPCRFVSCIFCLFISPFSFLLLFLYT